MILIAATKIVLYMSMLLFGVWCFILWRYRRVRLEASKLYQLKYKPFPLIGHLYCFVNKEWHDASAFFMDVARDIAHKEIQTACIWTGPFPLITVCGLEDIQKVLNSSASNEKSDEYKYFDFAVGKGLMTAPNHIWRTTRSHANVVLHPRNLEQLLPLFNQNCRELVKNLSAHLDGATFDAYENISKTTMKNILYLGYGPDLKIDINSKEFKCTLHCADRIPELISHRLAKPWLWFDFTFNYFHRQDMEVLKSLRSIVFDRVKESKAESFRRNPNKGGTDESSTNRASYLLETQRTMIENKPYLGLTDDYVVEELFTLFGSALDTTAGTAASCLIALGQYPDIQDKLYEEITSVVVQDEVTYEDIGKMQYLDQVFNEILRVNNVGVLITRKSIEDIKLSECTVPAGNTIVLMLAALNLNTKYFPNPNEFDPENFSPDNCMDREKKAFMPFGGGVRSCIGKPFVKLLVKMMVVHILRHYRVTTEMDILTMKRKWAVFLTGAEPYNIKLHKRNGN